MTDQSLLTDTDLPGDRYISGRKVVVAMFAMAFLATGLLWFYWNLHLQPFMPLQEALAVEFKKSSPRVDGGQRKQHKGTPKFLRVVMRVPFDPNATDAETQSLIETRIERTRELALKYTPEDEYEYLELHFYQEQKEQRLSQKEFQKSMKSSTAE